MCERARVHAGATAHVYSCANHKPERHCLADKQCWSESHRFIAYAWAHHLDADPKSYGPGGLPAEEAGDFGSAGTRAATGSHSTTGSPSFRIDESDRLSADRT
jgi:hypothetical protein